MILLVMETLNITHLWMRIHSLGEQLHESQVVSKNFQKNNEKSKEEVLKNGKIKALYFYTSPFF